MNYSPKNLELNATTSKPATIAVVTVYEAARVLGLDANETAKSLGLNATDYITVQQAQQLGKKKGLSTTDLTKMLSSMKTSQIQAQTPGDQLQIGLPNGKKISLADIEKLQQINPENCLLSSTDVDGQVSYIALLGSSGARGNNYDLNIGHSSNPQITSSNQHVASDSLVAALSLGEGGANILIPHQYARWLNAFSKINMADLIANTLLGATLYTSQSRIKKISDLEKELETQKESAARISEAYRGIAEERNSLINAREVARASGDEELVEKLTNRINALEEEAVKQSEANAKAQADMAKTRTSQDFAKKLSDFDEVIRLVTRRANYGLIMGAMWLGPARFLYTVNEGLLFSSDSLNATEKTSYYLKVFINKEVATEFRSATDFLGMGYMLEILSGWLKINAPHKAFQAGNYLAINNGGREATQATQAIQEQLPSTTSITGKGASGWLINTKWQGPSDLTLFEKISLSEPDNYSSLSLETNMLPPNAIITRRNIDKLYAEAIMFSVPFIATTKLTQLPGRVYTLVPFLLINELVMKLDHTQFAKTKCDPAVVNNYIYAYGAVITASNILNAYPATSLLKISRNAYKYSIGIITSDEAKAILAKAGTAPSWIGPNTADLLGVIDKLMLPQALQVAISSRAQEYVSACYDDQYQILGYQLLPQSKKSTVSDQISKMSQPLTNLSQQLNLANALNINKALDNIAQKFSEAERFEIINLRAQLQNQQAVIQPAEIYYLHFDASNTRWWNSFEQKCFRECFSAQNYSVCIDGLLGVYAINAATGEKTIIASPERAKRQLTNYDLARALIPNALIQSTLNCGNAKIMQVDSLAVLSITDLTCPAMQCMLSQLQQLAKRQANAADLSSILGKVKKIHTTEGEIDFGASSIRFVRTNPPTQQAQQAGPIYSLVQQLATQNKNESVGTETILSPKQGSTTPQALAANIYGNGAVKLSSATEESVGTLQTIQTENGMIDYDPTTGRLTITLYLLASLPIEAMKGIETSIACEEIRIDRINPKTGYEELASQFNAALQQIQADCGLAVLETPDKIYSFKKDADGNNIIQVYDKKTGQTQTYKITGPARMEGDEIVFPTDKGELRFKIFQDPATGKPMLQVIYPDGTRDLGELIAARGINGVLAFDPRTGTWYAYNAQDIPLNPAFASKGASFYQTPQGLAGQPTDNLAGYTQRVPLTTTNDLLTLLGLPAWPSPSKELPLFAAMIAAVLAGIAAARHATKKTIKNH
jgi:predicted DNA-binding protein YlxM (UPF0122 family)